MRNEASSRRVAKRTKATSSKYKVRKHGGPTTASVGPWEGPEADAPQNAESGAEDGARRHGRRRGRSQHEGAEAAEAAPMGRKHPSKTIIGKLGMTAGTGILILYT